MPAGGHFVVLFPAGGHFVIFWAMVCKCFISCCRSFLFPATAAGACCSQRQRRCGAILGGEFPLQYHSAIAEASNTTASPAAPPPPPPRLLLLLLLLVVSTAYWYVSKNQNRLSVVMTLAINGQCQCVCSSGRMAASVDTTAAVPQFLSGLSPASAPAAAATAAVWCCWWCCSHSLLRMFLKCTAFVVLIYAVCVDYSQKQSHVSYTRPYRFLYMP